MPRALYECHVRSTIVRCVLRVSHAFYELVRSIRATYFARPKGLIINIPGKQASLYKFIYLYTGNLGLIYYT